MYKKSVCRQSKLSIYSDGGVVLATPHGLFCSDLPIREKKDDQLLEVESDGRRIFDTHGGENVDNLESWGLIKQSSVCVICFASFFWSLLMEVSGN